jgi:deoxyribonuclease-4
MIKFGVAGNSNSFYEEGHKGTIDAAKWCKDRSIELFEYSFGRGISMSNATAEAIGNEFLQHNVELSIHAPYFINFANTDELMIAKSINYITACLDKAAHLKAPRVIFHAATQGKAERRQAVDTAKENIKLLIDRIEQIGYKDFILCPETMGKIGQIGTVEEIIEFCNMADYFYPCIDFGHINAREQGILKSASDYQQIIDKLSDHLPSEKVKNMHIHFSKIEYGKSGEIRHLTFEDKTFGPDFEPLAEVLIKNVLHPHIISESDGTQAEDAVEMKNIYYNLLTK